jgi:hypothetical protein
MPILTRNNKMVILDDIKRNERVQYSKRPPVWFENIKTQFKGGALYTVNEICKKLKVPIKSRDKVVKALNVRITSTEVLRVPGLGNASGKLTICYPGEVLLRCKEEWKHYVNNKKG